MKQVVMSIVMFAITSCAVESAPVSTSTTTDDESSQADRDANVDPHASVCEPPFGVCETLALCSANGGHVAGVCTGGQGICCHF
ncbi:MAG TPA: hypothetical protein VHW23_17980 [Kofleriaceae bacterium]|jgi:hypothetical protein|nr:hypothetical protein [Kofleriaceae bacterium]